jgi:hypothetical protein
LVSRADADLHLCARSVASVLADPAGHVPVRAAGSDAVTITEWAKRAFRMWPDELQRTRLAGEYAQMRGAKLMLADLCQRNHVFTPGPDSADLFAAGVAEGRRRAVLELLQLTRIEPMALAEVNRRRVEAMDVA